jgi:hypothetical protein
VLPGGFHRIRHYGLLANAGRRANLARVRTLLHVVPEFAELAEPRLSDGSVAAVEPTFVCQHCGGAMRIIETLLRHQSIRAPPSSGGPA